MKLSALIFITAMLLVANPCQSLQSDDKIYKEPEVTERAVILVRPKPLYPQQMWNGNCNSWPRHASRTRLDVKLKVVLLKSGEVGDIKVLKERPCGTTESSIEAARRIKFKPAAKNGVPVSQYLILTYYFTG
jgi:hypothetical protein